MKSKGLLFLVLFFLFSAFLYAESDSIIISKAKLKSIIDRLSSIELQTLNLKMQLMTAEKEIKSLKIQLTEYEKNLSGLQVQHQELTQSLSAVSENYQVLKVKSLELEQTLKTSIMLGNSLKLVLYITIPLTFVVGTILGVLAYYTYDYVKGYLTEK